MKTLTICAVYLAVLLLSVPAVAHQRIENDGTHVDAESALVVEDTGLSQVVYHEATVAAPRLWLTFSGVQGQDLYMQVGVPVIDRLADYRPDLVLLGPGLPGIDVPFDIPEGLGGNLYSTANATPEVFDEPFTGTSSWILLEETAVLPESGDYYLVAYEPETGAGKFWVSVGTREEFGLRDFLTYEDVVNDVRTFHEVADEPLPFLPRVFIFIGRIVRFFAGLF